MAEIKVLLIYILTTYDLKMKHGHGRPSNFLDEIFWIPDPAAEILIKSKKT